MPLRRFRRRPRTARPVRRRRILRRPRRISRMVPRAPRSLTYGFKRRTLLFGTGGVVNNLIQTSTGVNGGYYSVAFNNYLDQVPEYTEFTALYDYYKISFIVYRVTWLSTNISIVETANNGVLGAPYLYYYIDRDDVSPHAASAAGLNEMRAVQRCKRFTFTPDRRQCTIKFKPSTLAEHYRTVATTGYAVEYNKWLDTAQATMPYWGTKFMFYTPSNGSPSVANNFEVEATYYLRFKSPR